MRGRTTEGLNNWMLPKLSSNIKKLFCELSWLTTQLVKEMKGRQKDYLACESAGTFLCSNTSSPQHFLDHVTRHAVEKKKTRKEEGRKAETHVEQRDKYRT